MAKQPPPRFTARGPEWGSVGCPLRRGGGAGGGASGGRVARRWPLGPAAAAAGCLGLGEIWVKRARSHSKPSCRWHRENAGCHGLIQDYLGFLTEHFGALYQIFDLKLLKLKDRPYIHEYMTVCFTVIYGHLYYWSVTLHFAGGNLQKAGAERAVTPESCARKKARVESEAKAAASKIAVNLDHKLLECSACCSPLAPPLFQCANGHITCSECRTNVEYSCSLCAEPANTRCGIMERVLGGMTAPCSFREFGCSATIPFTGKLAHEESCLHAPCHCPIPSCRLYANCGRSLREHIETKHCLIPYGQVTAGRLSPVRVCDNDPVRLVFLDATAVFLLVVERSVPSGRTVSVVQLVSEPVKEEEEKGFKYKIQVHTRAGALSLSGETQSVGRLMRPYQATVSLFVTDAVWSPRDSAVYLELKLV